jgi:hypothetical protein
MSSIAIEAEKVEDKIDKQIGKPSILEPIESSQNEIIVSQVGESKHHGNDVADKVGPVRKNRKMKKMKGLFWNIRGLGQLGRIPALVGRLRDNHVDFVGVIETKKREYTAGFLRSLTSNIPFNWCSLSARGSARGILVGANSDIFNMVDGDILDFTISAMLTNKVTGFSFKLVAVYGSPYVPR